MPEQLTRPAGAKRSQRPTLLYTPSSSAFSRVDLPWKPPPTMSVTPRLQGSAAQERPGCTWDHAEHAGACPAGGVGPVPQPRGMCVPIPRRTSAPS